jgi:hypothetical protein
MPALFAALASFFTPVVVFFVSVGVIVAFLLAALANPQGWMNNVVCSAIDFIAFLFPSTPTDLKISSLINSVSSVMPAIGRGIISDLFTTIGSIVAIRVVVVVYKLLPFKAT